MISRTASPFLSAGGPNGAAARPKSPLNASAVAADVAESSLPAPAAIRSTPAVRKPAAASGGVAARKNILGAKKTSKLGAKKVVTEDIDFEAVEKAAKAEAERIEKLGYDPEAEQAEEAKKNRSTSIAASTTEIKTPTPINPASNNSRPQHQRNPSEVERLGMGVGRLGFGMVGKPAAAAAATPKKMGFGSVGTAKPTAQQGKSNSFGSRIEC